MDVDKQLRESVRTGSQNAVRDVRFSPEIANRIRQRIASKGKYFYRRLYVVGTAVACVAIAVGTLWRLTPEIGTNNISSTKVMKQPIKNMSKEQAKTLVENALKPVKKVIPEISGQIEVMQTSADRIDAELRESGKVVATLSVFSESGELQSFHLEGIKNELAPELLTREKTKQFLQQVLGDDFKNYRETSSADSYIRYYNGLPVLDDNLYTMVDNEGRVFNYTRSLASYNLASLPAPSQAVPKESAEAELAKNMKLRYIENAPQMLDAQTKKAWETGPLLDYTPAVAYFQLGEIRSLYWYIDAITGKIQYGYGNNDIDYDLRTTHEVIHLTPPKQPVTVKTKEEAVRLLKEEVGTDVKGLTFKESVQQDEFQKRKSFLWVSKEGKRIEVATSQETGQIRYIGVPRVNTKNSVSQKDAFKEAIRFLEKYVDQGVSEVQICQITEPGADNPVSSGNWQFKFFKSYEGVPVLGQHARADEAYTVSVDPSTGKANGFLNSTNTAKPVALPDKNKVVPVAQAVQEYLKYMPLQLAYTRKGADVRGGDGKTSAEPKLIYVAMNDKAYANKFINIDAVTGRAVIR